MTRKPITREDLQGSSSAARPAKDAVSAIDSGILPRSRLISDQRLENRHANDTLTRSGPHSYSAVLVGF